MAISKKFQVDIVNNQGTVIQTLGTVTMYIVKGSENLEWTGYQNPSIGTAIWAGKVDSPSLLGVSTHTVSWQTTDIQNGMKSLAPKMLFFDLSLYNGYFIKCIDLKSGYYSLSNAIDAANPSYGTKFYSNEDVLILDTTNYGGYCAPPPFRMALYNGSCGLIVKSINSDGTIPKVSDGNVIRNPYITVGNAELMGGNIYEADYQNAWGDSYITWLNAIPSGDPDDKDPNAEAGNSEPGGGKGTHERDSKIISPHSPYSYTAIDTGFITAFTPTLAQIKQLSDYMWTDWHEIDFNTIRKMFNDPMDAIIGLHILPISITAAGTKEIRPGTCSTGIWADYTETQFVEKNCGTLDLSEFWQSALDFAPYCKVNLFLPWIGMRTLNTDEVMGKTIGVKYIVDILSGALVAQVTVDGSVRYEFSGNCALQIPITGNDYRASISSAIQAAVTIGAGIASAGMAAPAAAGAAAVTESAAVTGATVASVGSSIGATANAVMNSKPTIERTGSLGGSAGYLGVNKPYVVIEYPAQSLPKDYMKFNGYPCNMTFTLSALTGYTQCETVRFASTKATDKEAQEIITLLQSGVILGGTAPTKPATLAQGIGVTFYTNASPEIKVCKELTIVGSTQTCHFKQSTDILTPTITISAAAVPGNYCYIDALDRWYYITDARSVKNGLWEIDLRVDVLTSYIDNINATRAIVARQENEWNLYLDDGVFKCYQNPNFYTEDFSVSFTTHSFVLIVAGSHTPPITPPE